MPDALWMLVAAGAAAVAVAVAVGARRRERSALRASDETTAQAAAKEREWRESREVQDLVLSSMREGVLLLGPGGHTAFANPAVEVHLGGRPSSAGDLFPVPLREAAALAARGEPSELEVELASPQRWLRVQCLDADEGAALLIVSDVTSQRRVEAVRRDFVANASHELKTPAATIRAAAETIAQAAIDDPGAVPRFADQLTREAQRLSRIVADLLDLTRLESGGETADDLHLDGLTREECQRAEEAARAAGLELRVETPTPAPMRGSARDLALLVRNLVDNAIRYTPSGGTVTVSVEPSGDRVTLRVADTGVGIPSRDLPRIFERFYRVDRARSRETGGTGLGLSIVKHVTDNHAGTVEIRSELGVGTTIEVSLPAAAASSGPPASGSR